MIIWINGAFGAGKTQTACALERRLPNSYVYDPENAGFFIRENIPPSIRTGDFQDYPLWRGFNYDMLNYISTRYSGDIIVPMTITDRRYYDELVGRLSEKYEVRHFILYAKKETLLRRLASRLEGRRSWAARQIDRCIRAFDEEITEYRIDTDGMTIEQTAERLAELASVPLSPDNRSRVQKLLDRAIAQCRHIRG